MQANPDSLQQKATYMPRTIERRSHGERRAQLAKNKKTAKIGMTVSLGALVVTGLMDGRGAKISHICSGIALIGFSVWHHQLYKPDSR